MLPGRRGAAPYRGVGVFLKNEVINDRYNGQSGTPVPTMYDVVSVVGAIHESPDKNSEMRV